MHRLYRSRLINSFIETFALYMYAEVQGWGDIGLIWVVVPYTHTI